MIKDSSVREGVKVFLSHKHTQAQTKMGEGAHPILSIMVISDTEHRINCIEQFNEELNRAFGDGYYPHTIWEYTLEGSHVAISHMIKTTRMIQ